MATKKQQQPEERKHRTYRVQDTPYFKAVTKAKKIKTTVSNVIEDVVILIAAGYGADVVGAIELIKAKTSKSKKKSS